MHVRRDDLLNGLKADPALASLQRSLDVYYGDAQRDAAMDKLYAAASLNRTILRSDVGSHVGDRIGSFRRCGARVVALEPQPDRARVIRSIYGEDAGVTLVESPAGPTPAASSSTSIPTIRLSPRRAPSSSKRRTGLAAGRGRRGTAN